jgi:hypothetical protein
VPTWTDEPRDPCLCGWAAACWRSGTLVPVSLQELLPGLRVCLQLLVCGVWDVCGWLFFILVLLSALCSSNSGTISCCSDVLRLLSRDLKMHQVRGLHKNFWVLEPRLKLFEAIGDVLKCPQGLCTVSSPCLEVGGGSRGYKL